MIIRALDLFRPETDLWPVPAVVPDDMGLVVSLPSDPAAAVPVEIAFLAIYGVEASLLLTAAATARTSGVTADRALLAAGDMSAQIFYELLAHYLGVTYLRKAIPVASDVRIDPTKGVDVVPLTPNAAGLAYAIAPRGETLALLLHRYETRRVGGLDRIAITSPQRLAALVRLHNRRFIVQEASDGLPDWNASLSARSGWTIGQRIFGFVTGFAVALGIGLATHATLEACYLWFCVTFLTMVLLRLLATGASRIEAAPPAERLPDHLLPIYTVVVPLFRESRMVPQLVAALNRLDYPAARLDIKIMVEANDKATLDALQAEHLPDRFEVLMAPAGRPQTKPRALNVALQFALGRYLVVYDAEDEPEPDQLRVAVDAFARAEPELACLQARLAIDNGGDSWLTRLFALEYAALFDVVNPGLARLDLPIALGGTSNHFRVEALRRVNGWDAWNVTEDIDLGIRLARFGYRVAMLPSSTFEEAPHTLRDWMGQRRRWQKGWMITLQTHSRDPARLFSELGIAGGITVFAILFGTVASSLFGPLFMVGVLLDAMFGPLLAPRTFSEHAWSGLAGAVILLGFLGVVWPIGIGMRRRGLTADTLWLLSMPAYLLLLSLATWQGLFEMMRRPYSWAKTEHGTAKHRRRPKSQSKAASSNPR